MDQQRSGRNDGGERRRISSPVYESSKPSKNGRKRASRSHQYEKNYQNYQDTLFHFQDHSQFSESVYQCNYKVLNHDVRGSRCGYSYYYPSFSSSAAQINYFTNLILNLSDLVLRTSIIPNNLPIQPIKSSSKYLPNNRSQNRPLESLNPNPIDNKYASNSEESVYKPTPKPELQSETKPEKTSPILKIQDSIYNPYIFRTAIPLPHTPGAPSFTGTNITDFLIRFKNIATDYGLSDDRKMQRVQKYYKFGITQRIQDLDSYEEKDWKRLIKEMKTIYKNKNINQQQYTRAYLTTLAHKARGEKEVNSYSRQFRSIAKELIKKRQFNKDNAV